jgi:hypothetical protein
MSAASVALTAPISYPHPASAEEALYLYANSYLFMQPLDRIYFAAARRDIGFFRI